MSKYGRRHQLLQVGFALIDDLALVLFPERENEIYDLLVNLVEGLGVRRPSMVPQL